MVDAADNHVRLMLEKLEIESVLDAARRRGVKVGPGSRTLFRQLLVSHLSESEGYRHSHSGLVLLRGDDSNIAEAAHDFRQNVYALGAVTVVICQ